MHSPPTAHTHTLDIILTAIANANDLRIVTTTNAQRRGMIKFIAEYFIVGLLFFASCR